MAAVFCSKKTASVCCSPVSCSIFQALWHVQFPDDPSFGRGDCWRLEIVPIFGRKHPQVPRSGEKTDYFISVSPFLLLLLSIQTWFTSSHPDLSVVSFDCSDLILQFSIIWLPSFSLMFLAHHIVPVLRCFHEP